MTDRLLHCRSIQQRFPSLINNLALEWHKAVENKKQSPENIILMSLRRQPHTSSENFLRFVMIYWEANKNLSKLVEIAAMWF